MRRDIGASRVYNVLLDMQLPSRDVALKVTKTKLLELIVSKIKTE